MVLGFGSLPDVPKFKTGLSNVDLSLSNDIKEVNDLLVRVSLVEKQCVGEKDAKDRIAEIEDDFLRTKALMYTCLQETRELIRERHSIQKRCGNNVETIQKKAAITEKLRELELDLARLQDIYRTQNKQKKKFSSQELDDRFQDINVLKRQIDETSRIARDINQHNDIEIKTLTELRAEAAESRFGSGGPGPYEEPSDEDKAVMARWKERDKQFDEQLGRIGEGVDRLGEIAVEIGHKADEQQELVTQLHTDADVATDELVEINTRIKKILGDGVIGFNCCCKVILAVILVALIGFAISLISKKIKYAAIT